MTASHRQWEYRGRRGLPAYSSPLVVGDALFLIKEGGLFTVLDIATGEVREQARIGAPDPYFASPVSADGKVYTASRSGQLGVISTDDWRVLSVHDLGEAVWSTPAIAGRRIFVRSESALHCFEDD